VSRFRNHTHTHTRTHTTVGRTPLDAGSARRNDTYLTAHNTHNREASMSPARFETAIPASDRPQTYALDRAEEWKYGSSYSWPKWSPSYLCPKWTGKGPRYYWTRGFVGREPVWTLWATKGFLSAETNPHTSLVQPTAYTLQLLG
jgi:hypothetical protein